MFSVSNQAKELVQTLCVQLQSHLLNEESASEVRKAVLEKVTSCLFKKKMQLFLFLLFSPLVMLVFNFQMGGARGEGVGWKPVGG